jgi:hypothetical protein
MRISPLARNLVLVALVALGLTLIRRVGSIGLTIVQLILSLMLLVMFLSIAHSLWRQNRGTIDLMPRSRRIALYGAVAGIVVLVLAQPLIVSGALSALLFFVALAALGFVVYRVWQESRRYHY